MIFFLFLLKNIDRGYTSSTPALNTHVNPSFTILKWGVIGYKSHGHVFLMCNDYIKD